MQNRLFQNTLTQLKKDVKRVVGVIDDSETVIACSDESRIGNVIDNIFTVFDSSGDIKCIGGFSYKKIETAVVSGYTKIEDAFVDAYLTRDGETVEEAKARMKKK